MLHFDGADSDYLYFSTNSWSGNGGDYTITISKRTGYVHCTCPDAVCRRKNHYLFNEEDGDFCKHQRGVLRWIKQRLDAS